MSAADEESELSSIGEDDNTTGRPRVFPLRTDLHLPPRFERLSQSPSTSSSASSPSFRHVSILEHTARSNETSPSSSRASPSYSCCHPARTSEPTTLTPSRPHLISSSPYRTSLAPEIAATLRAETKRRRGLRADRAYYCALQCMYETATTLGLMHKGKHSHLVDGRERMRAMLRVLIEERCTHEWLHKAVAGLDEADAAFDVWLRKNPRATPVYHPDWVWFEDVWRSERPKLSGIPWAPYEWDPLLASRRSPPASALSAGVDNVSDAAEPEHSEQWQIWSCKRTALTVAFIPKPIPDPDRKKAKDKPTAKRAGTSSPTPASSPSSPVVVVDVTSVEAGSSKRKREADDDDDDDEEARPGRQRRKLRYTETQKASFGTATLPAAPTKSLQNLRRSTRTAKPAKRR